MLTKPTLNVDLAALDHDPYPIFEQIRAMGGVAWIETLNMWYVVGYHDVRAILMNTTHFSTGTDHSLLYDTFGTHMLTQNGDAHSRARAAFRGPFAPTAIRAAMSENVAKIVDQLIDGFAQNEAIDLRSQFAARLPVLSIMTLFGFDASTEAKLRTWYDRFERALSNFTWDQKTRDEAASALIEFHTLFREQIKYVRAHPSNTLLSQVVQQTGADALSDDEIIRNASIIFFGGISTVEALLLNALYASLRHGFNLCARDAKTLNSVIDETMRWLSPVQSATRHVVEEINFGSVVFARGETVNCMLGAANRDPEIFESPEVWLLDRRNANHHLGFATGTHFCLGSHLAKLEVQIAITGLMERLPDLSFEAASNIKVRGFEFRQPKQLRAFPSNLTLVGNVQ